MNPIINPATAVRDAPVVQVRIVGAVALAIGVVLLGLLGWISYLCVVERPDFSAGVLVLMAALLTIGTFCAVVGYRMLFNRPNVHGSILPPVGWAVLGALFGGLAVYFLYGGLLGQTQLLPPAIFGGAFAAWCFYMFRRIRRRGNGAL